MTILFARSGYSPSGGAERYMQRLAGALLERGHEPVLLANPEWPETAWPGKTIRRIASQAPREFAAGVTAARGEFPGSLLFALQPQPGADLYRAAGGVHACWLQRLAAEGSGLAAWFRRRRSMHRQVLALERAQFLHSPRSHVIANSEMVAREIMTTYSFPRERLTVIPNGFNAVPVPPEQKAATRSRLRAQFAIPDDAPLIVFLGSGWKRKGADLLAEAFAALQHPHAHLILAGKGSLHTATPPRVHLPGPVGNPIDYLLAADLFALPTLYDPFSNACVEASALGLPVLTTDANGFAEALARFPRAGEAIPVPRSASAWRDALQRWLDPDLLAAARDDVAALAATYTFDQNVRLTVELMETLAARSS